MEPPIKWIYQNQTMIQCEIIPQEAMDLSCFEKMERDQSCLRCVLVDPKKQRLSYTVSNLVSMKDFLSQIHFTQEEGYVFLIDLLEAILGCNRDKYVVLDLDKIYVSAWGDVFYFLVIPLKIEYWMHQKEELHQLMEDLLHHLKIQDHYEMIGYIYTLSHSKEFSIPNLIQGLQALRHQQIKRWHFFNKPIKKFKCDHPIHSQVVFEPLYIQEDIVEENKTQLIGVKNPSKAYLIYQDEKYDLLSEDTLVGRSMACDIRLMENDVSLKHARIHCENERYYIQDLKSANGTYLNEKRVQRKMRLHSGMKLRFGNQECSFHQE